MPSKKPNKYVFTCRVWKRRDRKGAWCCTIKQAGCKTITKTTDAQHRGSAEEWAIAFVKDLFRSPKEGSSTHIPEQLEMELAPPQQSLHPQSEPRRARGGPQSPRKAA